MENEENNLIKLENTLEKKEEKIISWLKQPLNLSLFLALFVGIALRLYYFWITRNQPLWWDELCYGSLAKNLVRHLWDGTSIILGETNIRPMFFPFLWSLLLRIHLGEFFSRFFLVLLPSLISLFLIYLIAKEVYGKRAAIFSAFIFGVLWINLFYTGRLLVHMLDLAFLFASVLFFIKALKPENDINYKFFCYSLILLCITTITRYQDGMVFFIYLFILVLSKKLYLNKLKFWYAGLIGIAPMILFFIINFALYGNIFPALLEGDYVFAATSTPIAFNILNYIPVYLTMVFFILFLLGIIILGLEIGLGFSFIKKNEKIRGSLLLILILIVFFSFFIFYLRNAEDRWLFETTLSLSVISAFGLDYLYGLIRKYNKLAAIIVVLGLLAFGGYTQFKQADSLIKLKETSYLQMKQAFEWIEVNTPENSIILGHAIEPYAIYYSERQYLRLPENDFDGIGIEKAGYLVAHSFVPQPDYLNKYLQDHQNDLEPVNAFFFDSQQKQPAVIIYKIKNIVTNSSL